MTSARRFAVGACVALSALWLLAGAGGPRATACEVAAPAPSAPRHRIQFPDGSQLLLRREYQVIFRTPMRWSEGMLIEPVYVAEAVGTPGVA